MSSTTSIDTDSFLRVISEPLTLIDLLRRRSAERPDQRAYTFLLDGETEEVSMSYAELDRRARAIAAWLQPLVAPGERVLLLYPPGLDYIAAFFGCLYAGAVAVPAYPPRRNRNLLRLQAVVADAQASVALTTADVRTKIAPLFSQNPYLEPLRWLTTDTLEQGIEENWREPSIGPDALAFLQYTSGSTSVPKGVMLSHRNLLHNERIIQTAFRQDEHSVIAGWLPLYHDMGLIGNVLQPMYLGAPCILMSPVSFLQKPLRWLEAISRYRATTSGGPNFAYDLCARKVSDEQKATLDLSSWSVAFNGSEPIHHETLERFAEAFASCGFRREAFHPCYGLAEATLIVSGGLKDERLKVVSIDARELESNRVVETDAGAEGARAMVGCGTTLLDQKIVVVQPETLDECAPEQVGEIWVAGTSVAQGYWNQTELTESTFRARLAGTDEGPFLRTGDLGFMRDGELFITGRLKDLIVVRGLNHYPQDIELTVERCHPALRRGCGAAFSVEVGGEERVVVVQELDHRQRADPTQVMELISEAVVEEHDVQVHAVVLVKAGTVPKTSSGKIQRHACRQAFLESSLDALAERRTEVAAESEQTSQHVDAGAGLSPRRSQEDLEAWLRRQLAVMLRIDVEQIDVQQSITRYGLDSLTAIELMHNIEASLGIVVSITAFLRSPNVAELAQLVWRQLEASEGQSPSPVASHENISEHPLSRGQQSLWFLEQIAPESSAYHIISAVRISSEIDAGALRRVFQSLVDRHSSLRTTFHATEDGQPVQRVHQHMEVNFEETDAAAWSETLLNERLVETAHRPFDLTAGPLLRAALFMRAPHEHVFLLVMHHIVSDFWSLAVLLQEMGALYEAERAGAPAKLVPYALHYTDYVRWQQNMLGHADGERLWAYWHEQLGGDLSPLNLPADRPRPSVQTYGGASQIARINAGITARLKAIGYEHGTTLFMTLLAAYQALLHRYTGQSDVIVGSPTAGRNWAELGAVVGYFVNPLAMRTEVEGDATFGELLTRVRQTVLAAFEHQDYPFSLLVERLQPERDASRSPIFQTMFALQKSHLHTEGDMASFALGEAGARMNLGGLRLESLALEQRIAQFDLSLTVAEVEGELSASFEYNTDLYDASTIRRMLGHFETLLQSIAANPNERLRDLAFLTGAERRHLLAEFNDNAAERPGNRCVQHLFEEQAARTPDAVAVVFNGERLTYGELNARANQFAHHLRSLGVVPEMRVAVLMERSLQLMVSVLGVLKAGGAYVPLDPNYPGERLSFMVRDTQAPILLTQRWLLKDFDASGTRVVCFDESRDELTRASAENPAHEMDDENLAYVIFTSGSTGRPKGTMISHASLVNAYLAWEEAYRLRADTTSHLQMASFSFDVFAGDLLRALCSGSRLILCPSELLLAPDELYDLMQRERVDSAEFVPAVFRGMLQYLEETGKRLDFLNLLAVGSDSWYAREHEMASRYCGEQTRLINSYGLTETTIDSTYYEAQPGELHADASMPIGRAFANTQIYLLDGHLQLLPVGVPGELYVGGAGLSRGYLNRPALTAEKFIPHPYSDEPGARLYKSGDLARYLPDGTIELIGRIDAQVKIRGFRVEVGEIETALAEHPSVSQAVVVAREDTPGAKRLVAYLTRETDALTVEELRGYLLERMPKFMVPSHFLLLEAFPRTPNGKLDRRALPAPDASGIQTDKNFVAPREGAEQVLADIWSALLGVNPVGVHDNFFALGGDSILTIQVVARAGRAGLQLTAKQLFQYQTIAELVAVIGSTPDATAIADQSIVTGPVPLTPIQRWFFEQEFVEPEHYNHAVLLEVKAGLDPAHLEKAIQILLEHHDALRLHFEHVGGEWRQHNAGAEQSAASLERVDLRHHADAGAAIEAVAARVHKSLNLSDGPLLRAVYFEGGDDERARLLLVIHHLAVDGVSWRILVEDLQSAYEQLSGGMEVVLPPKTTSFRQWATLLAERGDAEELRGEMAYWESPRRARVAALPVDYRGGGNTEALARTLTRTLDAAATQALLHDVPVAYRTQINDVLLTALARTLARWTGERAFVIDLEGHGREEFATGLDVSRTVGWFTAVHPVLLELPGGVGDGEALISVKEQLRQVPDKGFGYGLLRYLSADAGIVECLRALPQAEVSFNYLGQLDQVFMNRGLFALADESFGTLRSERGRRSHLLSVDASISCGQLRVEWDYSAGLHHEATVARLADDFNASLLSLIAHCQSEDAGSFTPSDFPLAKLNMDKLSKLSNLLNEKVK